LRRLLSRFTPPPSTRATAQQAASADTNSQPPPSRPLPENPAANSTPRDSNSARHPLKNRDLDTGFVAKPGGYPLTDSTYADLLHRLTKKPKQPIPPGIKDDIEAYYSNLDLPITTKKDPARWKQVLADLETLRSMPTNPEPTPYPTYGEDQGADQ